MILNTYQIDPQEYAASKYPLSQIDNAVGEPRPTDSIFVGVGLLSRLSSLNRP
jgi:hypothetical protein